MRLLPLLNSIWRVPLILLATAILASISVMLSIIDTTGENQHRCARLWGRFILWVSRVRVIVQGMEKFPRHRGYIFMPNHLSMFDHWAFLSCLPMQFRFAAKASLFKIPFLGWHLQRSGNLPVDRFRPRQTLRLFKRAGQEIARGLSLVIYPEGERTFGEGLTSFKRGAFLLAKQAQAPIVPVTIIGAHRRLPRGSVVIRPGVMEMIFHDVIEFEEYRDMDLREISARVKRVIQESYRVVEEE